MLNRLSTLALLLFLCMLESTAQTTAFNPGVTANGVTYALPRTIIRTDAEAIRIDFTPGEFARYASRYLHLSDVRQEASTVYGLQLLTLDIEGEPDTLKAFTIKLKDKTVAPMVTLSDAGVILAVNTNLPQQQASDDQFAGRSTNHKLDSHAYLTEEILSATSTAKMAELTASEIYEIRETRNALMRGGLETMPKDGAAMKLVLDRLNEQEAALMQLFTGYSDTTWVRETYRLTPRAAEDVERTVLFRFSKRLGFVDADDLSGEPYYISVHDQHSVSLPSEKEAAKRKLEGIVYNLPSNAEVQIMQGNKTFFTRTFPIAQYGTIDQLAPALFGKGSTTSVTFHPATGGLLHLEQ